MKLLLDMNVSPKLVALLLRAGLDARHWSDAGLPSAEDTSIAEFALEHGTVVVTHDLDFGALLARTGQGRPSVIQIRADDLSVVQLADMLVLLCRDFGPELEVGALVTLDLRSTRIRSLRSINNAVAEAPEVPLAPDCRRSRATVRRDCRRAA